MNTRIILVDEHDNPVSLKKQGTLNYEDIYRVSALQLTDNKGEYSLISQRKWSKHNDPGKWAAAVAGTVDEGESYKENIEKETAEEIGLNNIDFRIGPKQYFDDGKHKFFCQWFYAQVNKDDTKFTIQEEEVEAVEWVQNKSLLADIKANPQKYVSSMIETLKSLGIKQRHHVSIFMAFYRALRLLGL